MTETQIAALLTRAEVAEHRAHEAEAEFAALRRDLADERAAVARAERAQRKAERDAQEARRLVESYAAKAERMEDELAAAPARGPQDRSDEEVAKEFCKRFGVVRVEIAGTETAVANRRGDHWESWCSGERALRHALPVAAVMRAARLARGE